jgi:hypothetical protein
MTTGKKILLAVAAVIFLAGIVLLAFGKNLVGEDLGNTLGVVLMLGGAVFLFGVLTSGGEED